MFTSQVFYRATCVPLRVNGNPHHEIMEQGHQLWTGIEAARRPGPHITWPYHWWVPVSTLANEGCGMEKLKGPFACVLLGRKMIKDPVQQWTWAHTCASKKRLQSTPFLEEQRNQLRIYPHLKKSQRITINFKEITIGTSRDGGEEELLPLRGFASQVDTLWSRLGQTKQLSRKFF